MANCDRCALCKKSACNNMAGEGPKGAELMVIGEAPGGQEEKNGRPFVGASGKYLRAMVTAAGWDIDKEVFFTNAVRCHPPEDKAPSNAQIFACRGHLDAEIAAVKPKRIIFVGAAAMKSCLEVTGMDEMLFRELTWNGIPCAVVYHPSYLLMMLGEGSRVETEEMIAVLKGIRGRLPVKASRPKIELVAKGKGSSPQSFKNKVVIFDLETTGLDWQHDDVRLAVITVIASQTAYVYAGDNMAQMAADLATADIVVGQNLKFDLHFVRHTVPSFQFPERVFDTAVAVHRVDGSLPVKLKSLAYIFTAWGGYDRGVKDADGKFDTAVSLDKLAEYCAMDCLTTGVLHDKFMPRVPEWFNTVMMPLLRETWEMEERGILVDKERMISLGAKFALDADTAQVDAWKLSGERGWNLNSRDQVAAKLVASGWAPTKQTKTGKAQVRDEDLESCGTPLAQAVRKYRTATKLQSTYIKGFAERMDAQERIHPSFNLTGTDTGRLSSSDPNFQNIPRDPAIRGLFIPDKGNVIVEGDYSQAELRVLAYYSGDKTLKKAYADGVDLHKLTASAIFNTDNPTDDQRQVGKKVNFGVSYGQGARALAEQIEVDEDVAQTYIDAFYKKFPGVKRWKAKWLAGGSLENGRIMFTNSVGFRRGFLHWTTDAANHKWAKEREAVNFPIQGTASEMTSWALVNFMATQVVFEALPMALIHDSIILQVPRALAGQAARALKLAMENAKVNLDGTALPADIKIIERWGADKIDVDASQKIKEDEDDGKNTKRDRVKRGGSIRLRKIQTAGGKGQAKRIPARVR